MHEFMFKPGVWIGEGHVSITNSPDTVRFFTRWQIPESDDQIVCEQEVELHGLQQTTRNQFTLSKPKHGHFKVTLKNDQMGEIHGKGVVDDKTIAWELRDHPGMEGFEVYELLDTGEYVFKAEYSSGDHFHTKIEGKIWRKT